LERLTTAVARGRTQPGSTAKASRTAARAEVAVSD